MDGNEGKGNGRMGWMDGRMGWDGIGGWIDRG